MKDKKKLIPCKCCGANCIQESGNYEICSICFWEDDGISDENTYSNVNHLTLKEAKANYRKFKACSIEFVNHVDKIG